MTPLPEDELQILASIALFGGDDVLVDPNDHSTSYRITTGQLIDILRECSRRTVAINDLGDILSAIKESKP